VPAKGVQGPRPQLRSSPRPEVAGSISPLAAEWDDLADRTSAPPFLRPGWFAAWEEAFGATLGEAGVDAPEPPQVDKECFA